MREKDKVYQLAQPATRVRITGMAPLGARVHACDRVHCNLCGEVYTVGSPPGIGEHKYDATASSMVGLLKCGTGTPLNRIEKLQDAMRIPLPVSTQWAVVEKQRAIWRRPTVKVLQLTREQRASALAEDADE